MVDAIIVLGGGISDEGILLPHSRLRVEKAVELWKKNKPFLLFSGRWNYLRKKTLKKTEGRGMHKYAIQLGVPKKSILLEEESMDTIGNAYFCNKRFIVPRKWKDIIIVTSGFHVARTRRIVQHILPKGIHYEVISSGGRPTLEHLFREIVAHILLFFVPWNNVESYLKKKYK